MFCFRHRDQFCQQRHDMTDQQICLSQYEVSTNSAPELSYHGSQHMDTNDVSQASTGTTNSAPEISTYGRHNMDTKQMLKGTELSTNGSMDELQTTGNREEQDHMTANERAVAFRSVVPHERIDEKIATCVVCKKYEHNLLVLPCLHQFCQHCLMLWIGIYIDMYRGHPGYFPCQICWQRHLLPSQGIQAYSQESPLLELQAQLNRLCVDETVRQSVTSSHTQDYQDTSLYTYQRTIP